LKRLGRPKLPKKKSPQILHFLLGVGYNLANSKSVQ
jgi:hypothetical protein